MSPSDSVMRSKPAGGVGRLFRAFGFSMAGLKAAYVGEAAFRQLVWMAAILIPLACWLDVQAVERVLLIGVVLVALIVELINSALEAIVDRISLEHHPLSGMAKDMGSAAQLMALLLIVVTWLVIVL